MMDTNLSTTKEALLEAAERLFSARGYAGVGIRQIAEDAGANIASIKYHFGGKMDLYLATVREVMSRKESAQTWDILADPPTSAQQAATNLIRFIRSFVSHLLDEDRTESCTNLIVRESLRPTEAMDAVVRDYLQPHMHLLHATISVLTDDDAPRTAMAAQAVMAQMLYHRIFRPIISRMQGESGQNPSRIADGIATFSLRGMGYDDAFITAALDSADAKAEAAEDHAPAGIATP